MTKKTILSYKRNDRLPLIQIRFISSIFKFITHQVAENWFCPPIASAVGENMHRMIYNLAKGILIIFARDLSSQTYNKNT